MTPESFIRMQHNKSSLWQKQNCFRQCLIKKWYRKWIREFPVTCLAGLRKAALLTLSWLVMEAEGHRLNCQSCVKYQPCLISFRCMTWKCDLWKKVLCNSPEPWRTPDQTWYESLAMHPNHQKFQYFSDYTRETKPTQCSWETLAKMYWFIYSLGLAYFLTVIECISRILKSLLSFLCQYLQSFFFHLCTSNLRFLMCVFMICFCVHIFQQVWWRSFCLSSGFHSSFLLYCSWFVQSSTTGNRTDCLLSIRPQPSRKSGLASWKKNFSGLTQSVITFPARDQLKATDYAWFGL